MFISHIEILTLREIGYKLIDRCQELWLVGYVVTGDRS